MLTWWMVWRVPVLLGIVMAAWWFGVRPVMEERGWVTIEAQFALCGEEIQGAVGCVIDGDTLVLFETLAVPENPRGSRRVRLTGFDAPELDGACKAERDLARKATAALHDWLGRGAFEWNGADDPPRDRYGRELRRGRRVRADGSREELAEVMIARGLAARNGWNSPRIDWCD